MINSKQDKGFTIIEVVLVLAIAALIFLMVFVAFPGLQRSQRDTGRKSAVATVITAVADYASNNRGSLPGASSLTGYVADLTTAGYNIVVNVNGTTADITTTIDTITVYTKTQCSTTNSAQVTASSSSRQFAVATYLESGGSGGVPYCQNG